MSFGKPEALIDLLGVTPGSVTALAALNDRDRKVAVVVDEALLEHPIINAHPLANDATTSLANEDFVRFLTDCGHDPLILKLSG